MLDRLAQAKKTTKKLLTEWAGSVRQRLVESPDDEGLEDLKVIDQYLGLTAQIALLKKNVKNEEAKLDLLAYEKYSVLTDQEVRAMVVESKWKKAIRHSVQSEIEGLSQVLAKRVSELADRYSTRATELEEQVTELASKVDTHLAAMGFSCN